MSNNIKIALAVSAALSLSGCLEVEDNNNNDNVVAALEAQNQLLQNQIDANVAPINLSATIKGASADVDLSDAQVSIKFGGEWSAPVNITNAKLLLTKQAANSDFLLKVTSPSAAFVSMTFKGMTKTSSQGQVISQDLGEILVGKPKEKLLTLLETGKNSYVENLEIYPQYVVNNSTYNSPYNYSLYNLELLQPESFAVYTKETGEYKLVLPEGISTELHAKLDVDSDGVSDFELELGQDGSATKLLSANKVWAENTLYLKEVNQLREYNLRLSLLDGEGVALKGARVSTSDNDNGNAYFAYDTASSQYVLDTRYRGALTVKIPSFTVGNLSYTSAEMIISPTEFEKQYRVQVSANQYLNFVTEIVDGKLNLVVALSTFSYQSPSITALSQKVKDNALEVFYSAPVELIKENGKQVSVTLATVNALKVILGNTTNDQGVSPGSTSVKRDNKTLESQVTLTLNGTKLTASPNPASLDDGEYEYRIGKLVNVISGQQEDVSNDNLSRFDVYKNSFSINDIVLDNTNYTTNGALVVGKNTADVAVSCSWCGSNSNVRVYFPMSINSLREFTLTMTSYTTNGVNIAANNVIQVVQSGYLGNVNKQYLLKASHNENVIYDSVSPLRGTSLESGYRYSSNAYLYLEDDTASRTNSATFDYSYTTKAGESKTGTITLKVM
jgi:hypothetical protein